MLYTAELLGFEAVAENSLDAVSDRDFGIEFNAAASLIMMAFVTYVRRNDSMDICSVQICEHS